MQTAETVLFLMQLYLWAGLAVALVFLGWGLDRIDAKATTSWMFRPLLVPGIAMLWPLVLWRWAVLARSREQLQARHIPPLTLQRMVGTALVASIPVAVFAALVIRQDGPLERPAQLLTPAAEISGNE